MLLRYNSLPCRTACRIQQSGGGITAETGRSSQFFLDFEVIDRMNVLEIPV